MSGFDYIVALLEAKGWHLYEHIPHAGMPEIISAGRARMLRPGVNYYLLPATANDASAEEVHEAVTEAIRTSSMPFYSDRESEGPVVGIRVADGKLILGSSPHCFAFDLDPQAIIEEAINRGISDHPTRFFDSIEKIETFLKERRIAPQRPPLLPSQLRWLYVHSDADPTMVGIAPENPSDVLFRGQGRRYLPCVSTATRGLGTNAIFFHELSEPDQACLTVNFTRTEWFIRLLRETSAVKWLKENQRVVVNEMAVAQHYGLPTGLIDLTQSFDVASFFACCRYDRAKKSWSPMAEGEGVVYAVNRRDAPSRLVRPINLQFFPRPSEQWGWTYEMRLGNDFDKLPFVWKFVFKHELEASRRILAKFSGGSDLFPDDPLSDLADFVVGSRVLPLPVAERIAEDIIEDSDGKPGATVGEILSALTKFGGVELSAEVTIPDLARINERLDAVWLQRRDSFFKGVGVRLVREKRGVSGMGNPKEPEQ
jgi:hypothetical protein